MPSQYEKTFTLLIADDDPDDRFLMRKALHDGGYRNTVQFVNDGEDLIANLKSLAEDPSKPCDIQMPSLILLDLNMPRLNGREALQILKQHSILKKIPVVVLTTSDSPEDVKGCFESGANSYFTKPPDYEQFVVLMKLLNSYWFDRSKLPN